LGTSNRFSLEEQQVPNAPYIGEPNNLNVENKDGYVTPVIADDLNAMEQIKVQTVMTSENVVAPTLAATPLSVEVCEQSNRCSYLFIYFFSTFIIILLFSIV
jgi:hypothetical protein